MEKENKAVAVTATGASIGGAGTVGLGTTWLG
jgi:hypothetical protein